MKSIVWSKIISGFLKQFSKAKSALLNVSLTVFGYAIFRGPVLAALNGSEASYSSGSPVLSLFYDPIGLSVAVVFILLPFLDRLLTWNSLGAEEHPFANLRVFFLIIGALLVWTYTVSEFNYYFNDWFFLERILIAVATVSLFWSPKGLGLLFVSTIVFAYQFNHPFFGADSDRQILQDMLLLSLVYFLLTTFRRRSKQELLFLLCLQWASFYFSAGLFKATIGDTFSWVTDNNLGFFVRNSLEHGLFPLSAAMNEPLANVFQSASSVFAFLVILIECSAILALFHRRIISAQMFVFPMLHAGLFLISGYSYWQWAVVSILIPILVYKGLRQRVWNTAFVVFFVLVVPFGHWVFHVPRVSWYDVPFADRYIYRVRLSDISTAELPASFFARYDLPYAWEAHHSLGTEKHLQILLGGSFYDMPEIRALLRSRSVDEMFRIEKKYGVIHSNVGAATKLKNAFTTYIKNYNEKPYLAFAWWTWLDAPKGMTYAHGDFLREPKKIRRFAVVNIKSVWNGERYVRTSEREVWSHEFQLE